MEQFQVHLANVGHFWQSTNAVINVRWDHRVYEYSVSDGQAQAPLIQQFPFMFSVYV